jgi:hypothetical protein
MKATATLTYTDWKEQTYTTTAAGKLTRASVKQTAAGDIEGEASAEWLMCYRADETADFLGLQRVDGRLGERSGSFVLESRGTFDGKEARGAVTVVPGSGTDDLAGITGSGEFSALHGPELALSLEYDL